MAKNECETLTPTRKRIDHKTNTLQPNERKQRCHGSIVASLRTGSGQDEVEGGCGVALADDHSLRPERLVASHLDYLALHPNRIFGE